MTTEQKSPRNVYQIVNDRIIAQLEKGVVPWKKTWGESGLPMNLITKKPYRGINTWLLASLDYEHNYFLSFRQVAALGGKVRKGEKSCPVVFWKRMEREDEKTKEKKNSYMLRYYMVFNIAQCDGIPETKLPGPTAERDNLPIDSCKKIIELMPKAPEIRHNENYAFYSPASDFVNMPKIKSFDRSESYYNALFHELIHSTGHTNRLNRPEIMEPNKFGSDPYSQEELVAEIGACYLSSIAGISSQGQLENNVAYLQSWLKVLKSDTRFVMYASSKAQRAVDFILGLSFNEEEGHEPELSE